MPAAAPPLDLSPEEQSFFDAGDHEFGPPPAEGERRRHHRSHRHSRHHGRSRFWKKLRDSGWRKASFSALLMIVAIWAGYRFSMFLVNQDLPDPGQFGVQAKQH